MNNVNLELRELHNLKEWAQIINVDYKDSTNSRKALIKELERYGKFIKVGRRYQYTEIYSEPKKKQDNRGQNPNSHKHSTTSYKELEFILLDYINKSVRDKIFITNNLLSSQVITNFNYYKNMKNSKEFNKYLKNINKLTNNTVTLDLFENINTSCKGILQTSLRNLKEKYNLQYVYNYIIIEIIDTDIEETRAATAEEIEVIENTTKLFISKFNKKYNLKINNLNDVNYVKDSIKKEFYNNLNTEIFEELYKLNSTEIKMYFKGYIINKLDNIQEILKNVNIKKLKKDLNKKFIKNMSNNIIKTIDKKQNEIDEFIENKVDIIKEITDVTDITEESVIGKNFNYRDRLMIKNSYKKEYLFILNLLLK